MQRVHFTHNAINAISSQSITLLHGYSKKGLWQTFQIGLFVCDCWGMLFVVHNIEDVSADRDSSHFIKKLINSSTIIPIKCK